MEGVCRDWLRLDYADHQLTISIRPSTKAVLDTLALMARKPAWRIIDELVWKQIERLPAEDRRALELVARRVEGNQPGLKSTARQG